ncbi:hypothetical protein FACS18945_5590 [Bacteroidia bacterium]|nr:hypothetical protein FACS18945_5590 [Bacteroidia bacterium]
MKYCKYIVILILNISPALALTDSAYIQPYHQKFDIKIYSARDFINMHEQKTDYKPNNPMQLGVGIAVKNSILNLGYAFNIGSRLNDELPQTKTFDFQLHHYGRKYMLDFYLQDYKGFYSDLWELKFYPKTQVLQIGAEGAYIFNGDRFSARAAFSQTERQLRSAGSFIVGGGTYFFRAKTETADLSYLQFGGNFGYAYSYVINPHWFLSGSLTGGAYLSNRLGGKSVQVGTSFNMLPRLSGGYNTDKYCIYLLFMDNMHIFQDNLRFNTGTMQIVFIWRFEKIPFIDKFKNKKS